MCACADVLDFKYSDLKMFLLILGSELQNLIKKFQPVLNYKQNTDCISTRWNAHLPPSPTNYACEQMKSKQKQNQVTSHSNWPRVLFMASLSDIRVKRMSGHGANPVFFNKKNKDWRCRTLATPPPQSLRPITPHFYITHHPHPLPPFTVDVICVSLLKDKL